MRRRRRLRQDVPRDGRRGLSRWTLAVSLGLVGVACWRWGLPVGVPAYLYLGAVVTGALRVRKGSTLSAATRYAIPLAMAGGLVVAPGRERWVDARRGREAWVLGRAVRFERAGIHTAWLEEELGTAEPVWERSGAPAWGGELALQRPWLVRALEALPSEARGAVLVCLCDPHNVLRAHQAALLAGVVGEGWPRGLSAKRWWERHGWVFARVPTVWEGSGWVRGWRGELERWARERPGSDLGRAALGALRVEEGWRRDGVVAEGEVEPPGEVVWW